MGTQALDIQQKYDQPQKITVMQDAPQIVTPMTMIDRALAYGC